MADFDVELDERVVSISDLESENGGLVIADRGYEVGWKRFRDPSPPNVVGSELPSRLRSMVDGHPEWLTGDKGGIYATVINRNFGAGLYTDGNDDEEDD